MNRREFLRSSGCGFGYLALAGMAAQAPGRLEPIRWQPGRFPVQGRRVIFLFMQGGVSHVDSYDYKPRLDETTARCSPSTTRARHRQHRHAGHA